MTRPYLMTRIQKVEPRFQCNMRIYVYDECPLMNHSTHLCVVESSFRSAFSPDGIRILVKTKTKVWVSNFVRNFR
jgi:hypothetical protein